MLETIIIHSFITAQKGKIDIKHGIDVPTLAQCGRTILDPTHYGPWSQTFGPFISLSLSILLSVFFLCSQSLHLMMGQVLMLKYTVLSISKFSLLYVSFF